MILINDNNVYSELLDHEHLNLGTLLVYFFGI